MIQAQNPYDWTGDNPRHQVQRRALLDKVREHLRRGESGYLLGCRGMGKSVFLRQLQGELPQAELDLLSFRGPGTGASVASSIRRVAQEMVAKLAVRGAHMAAQRALESHAAEERLRELFELYLQEAPEKERLVLLYDELDAYVPFGRPFFNELEDVRKGSGGRVVIFAAGGLGLTALDTLLGSSFFSRMTPSILEPFQRDELDRLADPFTKEGSPLPAEVLSAVHLASGGNLGLATYGLQHLWFIDAPSPRDVAAIFSQFRARHSLEFLDKIRDPIFKSILSDAPARVWREFERTGGKMPRARLQELIEKAKGEPSVNKPEWVLRMLRSSGLIRASDDTHLKRNIDVEIIPSILTLDVDVRNEKETVRDQLVADLSDVIARIHRMSADFFRPEEKGNKQLVPEATFSAFLALGLELRGWKVEREAQSAAGRTDIKACHVDFKDQWAIIEVKIWPRNDYADIHSQVVSYWSDGVVSLAAVMIADLQDEDWPEKYARKCLEGKTTHTRKDVTAPLAGHFMAKTDKPAALEVDHFLLRLARGT